MTAQELKLNIHDLVNGTDDPEILQSIYVLLKKLLYIESDEDILGYEADGTPITADDFIRSIMEADEDVEQGNGLSHEAMKAKYLTAA
jgi:hypothetical protein